MMDYDDEEGQYSAVIRSEPAAKPPQDTKKKGDTVIKRSDIQGKQKEPAAKKPVADEPKKSTAPAEQQPVKQTQPAASAALPVQEAQPSPAQVKPPEASPKIVPVDKPAEKPRELNQYLQGSKFTMKFGGRAGGEARSDMQFEAYCLKENASKWAVPTPATTAAKNKFKEKKGREIGAFEPQKPTEHPMPSYPQHMMPAGPMYTQPVPDMMGQQPFYGYPQPMVYPQPIYQTYGV
jgi:hypothetical protein